jgi:hypothetical protein
VDYKFFLGSPITESDEVFLDVPDDLNLIPKIRKTIEYAVLNNYDWVFKCDVDTYVCVPRLLKSGFEKHEFSGFGGPYGGSGYWMSRRAFLLLHENGEDIPTFECEDWWVPRNLKRFGIEVFQDARYHSLTSEGPTPNNDIITVHWYSEHGAVRNGRTYERIIRSQERLSLFNLYYVNSNSLK